MEKKFKTGHLTLLTMPVVEALVVKRRMVRESLKPQMNICHQKGHWNNNCPNTNKTMGEFANLTVNSLQSIDKHEVGKVMIAIVDIK